MARNRKRLVQDVLRRAKIDQTLPAWLPGRLQQKPAQPALETRRQRRRRLKREKQKAKLDIVAQYRDVRIPGVDRPRQPLDQCHKCGDVVVFRATKRKPKPGQTYAYHGYLRCPTCRTMYLCDEYKYDLEVAIAPPPRSYYDEGERERLALDKTRRDWLKRVETGQVRLVKRQV